VITPHGWLDQAGAIRIGTSGECTPSVARVELSDRRQRRLTETIG
jgi:hypothetical protein